MRQTSFWLAAMLGLALLAVTYAGAQQSLGELAKQQRQAKRPSAAKVYTNDDFSPVAETSPQPAAKDQGEKSEKEAAQPEDKAKLAADFKAKAGELKKNISLLERELDVAQRDYRLKVAVYYADVGNNLRDSKKWSEEDRKQRAEIEAKQKALNENKQKLANLQEQARKAGVRIE